MTRIDSDATIQELQQRSTVSVDDVLTLFHGQDFSGMMLLQIHYVHGKPKLLTPLGLIRDGIEAIPLTS